MDLAAIVPTSPPLDSGSRVRACRHWLDKNLPLLRTRRHQPGPCLLTVLRQEKSRSHTSWIIMTEYSSYSTRVNTTPTRTPSIPRSTENTTTTSAEGLAWGSGWRWTKHVRQDGIETLCEVMTGREDIKWSIVKVWVLVHVFLGGDCWCTLQCIMVVGTRMSDALRNRRRCLKLYSIRLPHY
jgi:hypothetical protein